MTPFSLQDFSIFDVVVGVVFFFQAVKLCLDYGCSVTAVKV